LYHLRRAETILAEVYFFMLAECAADRQGQFALALGPGKQYNYGKIKENGGAIYERH
jgi:hypothetical protein